ncbi:hypothetical protein Phum_PHUM145910 [Pediculus humanus corporis]|uniref:Ig-like domain-containing protein n=1 Tax=Pediculus humanus subsp. corporis TaxID=121224 RepID=E0VF47_PEDHC|nr:uncharacterized protein Phum_PHUM145910 [Pediculus humanus corporis]EEB11936.1 hypothetical protein Phum_PHUM145910 [Pediculus humanus corporis]
MVIMPADDKGNCLQINELIVPNVVENGSKSAVVLDCDYSINNSETGLVVKWFLNDGDTPVYQWIPPQRPQDLGKLKIDSWMNRLNNR